MFHLPLGTEPTLEVVTVSSGLANILKFSERYMLSVLLAEAPWDYQMCPVHRGPQQMAWLREAWAKVQEVSSAKELMPSSMRCKESPALLKLVTRNCTLLPKGILPHIKNSDYNVILSEVKHLPVCWENNFPEYNVPLQLSRNIYTALI